MKNCCFAAVDMGTNSFHMIIARLRSDGRIKIIDREKEVIRLGSQKGKDLSFISDDETESAINALKKFKKLADTYKARVRAVATSAVREAENRSDFISKVNQYTGINVEVIDGREEAELIFTGADKALSLSDKNVLCIDIGGGSTEIINVNKSRTVFAESVKLGAVRLSKLFLPGHILTKNNIRECDAYIEKVLNDTFSNYINQDYDMVVGTSGTIEAVCVMALKYRNMNVPKSLNSVSFSNSEMAAISNMILNAETSEKRLAIPGMEEKRADIIPAGVLILDRILRLFGITEITISSYALREGIILDMMKKYRKN
jgi:exopolyphosphatase/guanosine-5'-triphosphate,3'-diphosphate pyrophosphatase